MPCPHVAGPTSPGRSPTSGSPTSSRSSPEDDQVAIIAELDPERAADVLEHMEPDVRPTCSPSSPTTRPRRCSTAWSPEAAPVRLLVYAGGHRGRDHDLRAGHPSRTGGDDRRGTGCDPRRGGWRPPPRRPSTSAGLRSRRLRGGSWGGLRTTAARAPHSAVGSIADTRGRPLRARVPRCCRDDPVSSRPKHAASMPVVDSGGRLLGAVTGG